MKALKVTISGSYKTAQNDIIDFEDVTGIIPFVDDEHAAMHVRSRYATVWVKSVVTGTDKKVYPERIEKMRQVFIDELVEVDHEFSYVGKDIKKMAYEELEDLATAKDLRSIPLPKSQSGLDVREARFRAYLEYSDKVMNNFIDEKEPPAELCDKTQNPDGTVSLALNLAKFPELIVDGEARIETSGKVTNDEIIENEMKPQMNNETPKDSFTLEELKTIADKKGISYHWNIGRDKLYSMLYGGQ